MKILLTGKGSSGSWKVRGEQSAEGIRALGVNAVAIPKASVEQMRAADVIVLVKRPTFELLDAIRKSGKPFAWDTVDAWPQPVGNEWPKDQALSWLRTMIADVAPNHLICATRAMMEDAAFPSASVIYHHARPGLSRNEHRRNEWLNVWYDGGDHYLGSYESRFHSGSSTLFAWPLLRGLENAHRADVAICLRDCSGYAPRHWKSNVKLANAQALGIPALCSPESGYKETSTGGVLWIESPEDLPAAFDTLADPARYAELCAGVDAPPTLAEVAAQYVRELRNII